MAKKAIRENSKSDVDLTDTYIGQIFAKTSSPSTQSSVQTDLSTSDSSMSNYQGHDSLSRSQLISNQHKDLETLDLFHKALSEDEASRNQVCYYIKNGVLMRKWRPPDVPVEDEWTVKHQIVVPKLYRSEILSLAHENQMSGHLGVNKTYHKILNHFFWPGLKADVSKYCKSCREPNQAMSIF